MSRDDFDPNFWGNPGAVSLGYIPDNDQGDEQPPALKFATTPERPSAWSDLEWDAEKQRLKLKKEAGE